MSRIGAGGKIKKEGRHYEHGQDDTRIDRPGGDSGFGAGAYECARDGPRHDDKNHKHCDTSGGGGGDATYAITLTDDFGGPIAAGNGVEGAGGSIDGLTGSGSFENIVLGSILTQEEFSNLKDDYNEHCGDSVNSIRDVEGIDDIRVVLNPEIDDVTVVVEYMVDTQSFTLLLQGLIFDFPTSELTPVFYDLNMWNNRGGGKGKKNRCGSGTRDLEGVTMEIVLTSQ